MIRWLRLVFHCKPTLPSAAAKLQLMATKLSALHAQLQGQQFQRASHSCCSIAEHFSTTTSLRCCGCSDEHLRQHYSAQDTATHRQLRSSIPSHESVVPRPPLSKATRPKGIRPQRCTRFRLGQGAYLQSTPFSSHSSATFHHLSLCTSAERPSRLETRTGRWHYLFSGHESGQELPRV